MSFSEVDLNGGGGLLLPHTRHRSNTVATFPRTTEGERFKRGSPLPPPSSLAAPPEGAAASDFFAPPADGGSTASSYHRSNESIDLLYSTDEHQNGNGTNRVDGVVTPIPRSLLGHIDSPSRARAATIGNLDPDHRETIMRRRAGTTAGLPPAFSVVHANPTEDSAYLGVTRGLRAMSLAQGTGSGWGVTSSGGHSPQPDLGSLALATPTTTTFALTPPTSSAAYPQSHQQPTRSLWIGNLDPSISPAELQNVFSPYGAIESVRLIHDKSCAFVNFVAMSNAIQAKDDILTRLGGHLNGHTPAVRIGFGKAESASPSPYALGRGFGFGPGPGLGVSNGPSFPNGHSISPNDMTQSQPTRALWIGSIPSTTTSTQLLHIFSPFGPIESVRALSSKSCGFINFERLDDAVAARRALNGRELLGPDVGACRIGFAKVPTKLVSAPYQPNSPYLAEPAPATGLYQYGNPSHAFASTLGQVSGAAGIPLERQGSGESMQDYRSNLLVGVVSNAQFGGAAQLLGPRSTNGSPPSQVGFDNGGLDGLPVPATATAPVAEMELLMRELSGDSYDTEDHVKAVAGERPPASYYTSIPSGVLTDTRIAQRYSNVDSPRLRDLRKRLESNISDDEVDAIAYSIVDEVVGLASDYLGNVVVQAAFARASLGPRLAMLDKLGPHLAAIGTHKNGTWAVQKVINAAQTEEEFAIIKDNLQPYAPPLMLDSFGNYVLQCCQRFPEPLAGFMFDAMVDRCWEIGSGRFGARSMRQVLEKATTSSLNVKRIALAIILNSIPLATSPNGALLVSWLLDNADLPGRFRLLAPRFAPHLVHLCTHKLSSQAVLKILNQDHDPDAARVILQPLLADDNAMLEEILADQVHGQAIISKVLDSKLINPADRDALADKARQILVPLQVQTIPAYRNLLEQLGLPYHGVIQPAGPGFGVSPQQQWQGQPGYGQYPMPYYDPSAFPYGLSAAQGTFLSPGPYAGPQAQGGFYGPAGNGGVGYGRANGAGHPGFAPFSPASPALSSPRLAPTPSTPGRGPGQAQAHLARTITSPDPFQSLRMGAGVEYSPAFSPTPGGRGGFGNGNGKGNGGGAGWSQAF